MHTDMHTPDEGSSFTAASALARNRSGGEDGCRSALQRPAQACRAPPVRVASLCTHVMLMRR